MAARIAREADPSLRCDAPAPQGAHSPGRVLQGVPFIVNLLLTQELELDFYQTGTQKYGELNLDRWMIMDYVVI